MKIALLHEQETTMIDRRSFLGSMLALCAAPAIVRAESIMRIRPIWDADNRLIERCMALRIPVPMGTYVLRRPIVWSAGETLILDGSYLIEASDFVGKYVLDGPHDKHGVVTNCIFLGNERGRPLVPNE